MTAAPAPLAPADQLGRPIGPRVRALREAMRLSLRDLGERAGVSAPMLSQVERGETSPTLAVAGRIASGLDLSLSQLLRLDEADGVSVVRAGAPPARAAPATTGIPTRCSRRPSPVSGPRSPCTRSRRERPPEDSVTPRSTSPGRARPRWSPIGRLTLLCDGAAHDLAEGDAVTFDADLPHHFENPGPGEARFFAVVSAGLRRS
ncbi:MAG: XRE family transcriptional regulator [Thermoleophilaceae bacterium]